MKTLNIIAAIGMLVAALPAAGQAGNPAQSVSHMDRLLRQQAAKLGAARLDPSKAEPVYTGTVNADPKKDPWRPVTSKQMKQTNQDPWTEKATYSLRAMVDFNGDGHMDAAQAYNNSRQGAVIVTFGGPEKRAPLLIFKMDRRFLAGEEIVAAGRNRILVSIPDARSHLLFMDRSGPKVITYGG